jgi:Mg2+ and Co2+ transporter CorA
MASSSPGQQVADLPWIHVADPHFTEQGNYTFVVAKYLRFELEAPELRFEDFNIFVKPDHVVTVSQCPTAAVQKAQDRLRQASRPVAVAKLIYVLLDIIVDEYAPALYRVGEEIDEIEDVVLENPSPKVFNAFFTCAA